MSTDPGALAPTDTTGEIDEAEARISDQLQSLIDGAADAGQWLERIQQHRADAQTRFDELDEKIDRISSVVSDAVDDLDNRHESAQVAVEALAQLIQQHQSTAREAAEQLENQQRAAQEATALLDEGVHKFQSEFSAAVMYLEAQKRDAAQAPAASDSENVEPDPSADPPAKTIGSLQQQIEQLQRDQLAITERLESDLAGQRRQMIDRLQPLAAAIEQHVQEQERTDAGLTGIANHAVALDTRVEALEQLVKEKLKTIGERNEAIEPQTPQTGALN